MARALSSARVGQPWEFQPLVMLQFDAQTTRVLDNAYRGSDVITRRLAALQALEPRPEETIVDVGCGPGFLALALELARAVGRVGEVFGVAPSPDRRNGAGSQCAGLANVRILDGTA